MNSPVLQKGDKTIRLGFVYVYYFSAYQEKAKKEGKEVWPCKIGFSNKNPIDRIFDQIMTAWPELPKIGIVMQSEDAKKLESLLHGILTVMGKRVRGSGGTEWFLTTPGEVFRLGKVLDSNMERIELITDENKKSFRYRRHAQHERGKIFEHYRVKMIRLTGGGFKKCEAKKTWRDRITEAEKCGGFTRQDRDDAGQWKTGLFADYRELLEKAWDTEFDENGEPIDPMFSEYGFRFSFAVNMDNFVAARLILKNIKDHANELAEDLEPFEEFIGSNDTQLSLFEGFSGVKEPPVAP
jgi:hypothetical protein